MSESIDTIRGQLWEKMRDKSYRDTFVAAHLSTNIAAQIQTIREQRGWTKKQLAQKAGMSPSRITVMEDPSYEKFTLTTLKRLASAFDVALIARFAAFSDLVDWVAQLSPEKLETPEFEKDALTHIGKLPASESQVASNESTIASTAKILTITTTAPTVTIASTAAIWKRPEQGLPDVPGSPMRAVGIPDGLCPEVANVMGEKQMAQTL